MNNGDLLKHIEKLLKPLSDGQQRLEIRQEKLEEGQQRLEIRQEKLEEGQQRLEQNDERIELKVELVNSNLKKSEREIIDNLTFLFHNAATQKQVDELQKRVSKIEEERGIHN